MDNETPPKSRGPVVVLVVLLLLGLVGAGVGGWFLLQQAEAPPVAVVDAGTPVVETPDAGEAVDVTQAEPVAQKALKDLVPDAWLQGGDVARRIAGAVDAVSNGESPRVMLSVMNPGGTLIVEEAKGEKKGKKKGKKLNEHPKLFISEKNDERYDKVTQVLTSIDPASAARVYTELRPYLHAAYREIAPPGKTFEGALGKAIDLLGSTPISDGPREVVQMSEGTGYAYVDPKLEALTPAQKHLLRMGPKNARAVVKQLEAFRAALP